MPVIYQCDGCKKQELAEDSQAGFLKPFSWFQRFDRELSKNQLVCSRACIEIMNERLQQQIPVKGEA